MLAIAAGNLLFTLVDIPLIQYSYLQGITQIKEETKTNRNKFTEKISATAAADAA